MCDAGCWATTLTECNFFFYEEVAKWWVKGKMLCLNWLLKIWIAEWILSDSELFVCLFKYYTEFSQVMKQTQNCFLMPFLGLAFLRKEFLKSRPCLQDQRTPQLFCCHAASDAIDAMKGLGFSWVPKAACNHITFSWKLFFVHALGHSERNFREHLILLELKCIFFSFLWAVGMKT